MTHALAQLTLPWVPGKSVSVPYPTGFLYSGNTSIGPILSNALPIVIGLAGLGLLLMIILAGYTLMTSAGDAKKMEEGKQRLTFAILGFLIVFGAYWLVQILGVMFGPEITTGFR